MSYKFRAKTRSNTINNKIIEPLKDDAQVLGPGQMAPHLVRTVVNNAKLKGARKRKHTDSQSEGLSLDEMMADSERKANLNYETDDAAATNSANKTNEIPKSDNLNHILVQGLNSQNDNMIHTALQRSDPTLIRNTIIALPNDMIESLLNHLHKFLFNKGEKNRTYILWLETLLRLKLSIIISSPSIQEQLASIRELLEARCEIFERLHLLKGKLNLITDQIDRNSAETTSNSNAKIVYHESSSDEENTEDEDDERGSSVDSDVEEMEQFNLLGASDQDDDSDEDMDDEEDTQKGDDNGNLSPDRNNSDSDTN